MAELLPAHFGVMGGITRNLFRWHLVDDHYDKNTEEMKRAQKQNALNDGMVEENPILLDSGKVASSFDHLWSLFQLQPSQTENCEI